MTSKVFSNQDGSVIIYPQDDTPDFQETTRAGKAASSCAHPGASSSQHRCQKAGSAWSLGNPLTHLLHSTDMADAGGEGHSYDLSLSTRCRQSVKWSKLARKLNWPHPCACMQVVTMQDEGFRLSYLIPQNIKKKQECLTINCSSAVTSSFYYTFLSIETFASESTSP